MLLSLKYLTSYIIISLVSSFISVYFFLVIQQIKSAGDSNKAFFKIRT